MKLEIKHLAAYLPYGLNIKNKFGVYILSADNIGAVLMSDKLTYFPLLRNLSDLTKPIEVNGEKFVPYKKLGWGNGTRVIPLILDGFTHYKEIQLLLSWHFDVFGLIEKGLAIDINTLEHEVYSTRK